MIKDKKTTIGYHCPFCGIPILNRVDIFSMSNKMLKLKCPCGESELVIQITKENKVRLTVPCIICPVTHSFTLSSSTFFDKELFFLTCTFTAIGICFFGRSDKVINAMKENEEELIKMFKAYDEYNADEYVYTSGFMKVNADDGENENDFEEDLFDDNDEFFMDDDDDDEFLEDFDELEDFEDDDYGEDIDWNRLLDNLMENIDKDIKSKAKKDNQGFEIYKGKGNGDNNVNADEITVDATEKIDFGKLKIKSPLIFEQILSIIYKMIEDKKIYCSCGTLGTFDGSMTIREDKIILECKICGAKREIKARTSSDLEYFFDIDALYLDED